MEALQFGQSYNSKHHVVSPWLRFWVLEYVVALPLNINSYHICRCCHVLSLVATEATFLWSLLFMSVSCSLCCMGFSSLFCLKSRCAWLVLKFSLHQLFTCKHSLNIMLVVCSMCMQWMCIVVDFLLVSCVCFCFASGALSHKPIFPGLSNLELISHIVSLFHTWPLFDVQSSHTRSLSYSTLLWCSNLTNLLFLIPNPLSHY
jgi:hypothetical protein